MESLNRKDPYMMLSLLNMKLRDECPTLIELCKTYDMGIEEVTERMSQIGYTYDETHNQFTGM